MGKKARALTRLAQTRPLPDQAARILDAGVGKRINLTDIVRVYRRW